MANGYPGVKEEVPRDCPSGNVPGLGVSGGLPKSPISWLPEISKAYDRKPPLGVAGSGGLPPGSAGGLGRSAKHSVYVQTIAKLSDNQRCLTPPSEFALLSEFTTIEVSEWYSKLISSLGLGKEGLRLEFKGWKKYRCNECGAITWLPVINCGKYHPYTSRKHLNRVVARVLNRFKQLNGAGADYFIHLVLTAPEEISNQLPNENIIKRFRKAVNWFFKNLPKSIWRDNHKGSKLGGFYALHLWSTENPFEPHLHAHLLIPNVALGKDNQLHRFKPFLSNSLVRGLWKQALKKFGLWDKPEPSEANAKLIYSKMREGKIYPKLVHRVRYISRRPVADLNNYGWENFDSSAFLDMDIEFVRYLVGYTPRLQPIGFWANLKKLGFVVEPSDSRKSCLETCPLCGSEMEYLGFSPVLPEDIDGFIRDRSGWVRVRLPQMLPSAVFDLSSPPSSL